MRPFLRAAAAAAALSLTLAGCAAIVAAPAGDYKAGTSQVTLDRTWSDISGTVLGQPKVVRLLSLDGALLNRVYVIGGLKPGEFMVKPENKETPTPLYRAGLSATELVEFITDNVVALGYQGAEPKGLKPGRLGDTDGVRIEIACRTKDGLEMKGLATVAEKGGKLYAVLYLAPAEHYYEASLPQVEAIIGSARLS